MEILISKKVILALITLAAISFYISYTFNTCLVSSIAKALPKWRHHPVVPNGDTVIHYRTSVRVVPLLEGNESDISPKYKFFREQGLRPMRQLPSALIIGFAAILQSDRRPPSRFLALFGTCFRGLQRDLTQRHFHSYFVSPISCLFFTVDQPPLTTPEEPLNLLINFPVCFLYLANFLVVGVKKGGTRALLEFIRIHPDVRAAGNEVHFFDKNYPRGFEWYRERMPPTLEGQLTIEKTPSYFITKEAPRRVQHMNPSTKLLVVVRDPVTRAISDYTQAISKKPDMKPFDQLVFINSSIGNIVDTSWGPVKLGIYSRYLARWLKYFPLSQFLFISGERLVVDPAVELKRVQDFLGLKRVVSERHFYFNSTKGFPCLFKSEGHSTPHCLGKTKGRNHPHIDPLVLQRLRDFYRPFNNRFYQMTGINFGWA